MAQWVKNPPAVQEMQADAGWISGLGRSSEGGQGNPLQYSCLENPLDRGAWWATVHSVAKSQTQLKQLSMHAHINSVYMSMPVSQPTPHLSPCAPRPWYSYILLSVSGTPFFFLYASLFCTSQNMIADGS